MNQTFSSFYSWTVFSIVGVDDILSIHSSVAGHSDSFYFFAIKNHAVMNIHVLYEHVFGSPGCSPKSGTSQ